MNNLQKRTLTSLIIFPLSIFFIFQGGDLLLLFLLVIFFLGNYELFTVFKKKGTIFFLDLILILAFFSIFFFRVYYFFSFFFWNYSPNISQNANWTTILILLCIFAILCFIFARASVSRNEDASELWVRKCL